MIIISGGSLYLKKNKNTQTQKATEPIITEVNTKSNNMKLTSSAFNNNQPIPSKYTCDGENVNPPLTILDVPSGTKNLALTVDDPDAPMGTWVHWILWNIDPKTSEIAENSVPAGSIQGMTNFGKPGYGGPCPPSGTHRYFFKLYALDTILSTLSSSKKEDLEKAFAEHVLDKTELIGLYNRK